ncbi:MAG: Bacteriophage repressor helix-turn-helix domain [Pseudomonadota bacterium]
MSNFFERLDYLRRKNHETIAFIADVCGVSGPAVHGWRKGGLPKPDKLNLLASHYGVTIDWLLYGRDEGPPQPSTAPPGQPLRVAEDPGELYAASAQERRVRDYAAEGWALAAGSRRSGQYETLMLHVAGAFGQTEDAAWHARRGSEILDKIADQNEKEPTP